MRGDREALPDCSPLSAPVRPFVRAFPPGWHPRPSRPRNRPVAACEPGVRQEPGERRTAGTRGRRGKKTVQVKAVVPFGLHRGPHRPATRGGETVFPGFSEKSKQFCTALMASLLRQWHEIWHGRYRKRPWGKEIRWHDRRHDGRFCTAVSFRCIPGIIVV